MNEPESPAACRLESPAGVFPAVLGPPTVAADPGVRVGAQPQGAPVRIAAAPGSHFPRRLSQERELTSRSLADEQGFALSD